MNNAKFFENTYALQQLPVKMKLSNTEWRFLLAANGKTPVYQIQQRLGLTQEETSFVLSRLCVSGLLNEKTNSLEEFAEATIDLASADAEPKNLAEYLHSIEVGTFPPQGIPAFSPLQKPSAPVPTVRSMSLQSVIQFILNQTSDPTAGHLATYQIFMGIDTQLLKRNGITSLRFQDDRFITDEALQDAIAQNILKILRVPCPEAVFAGHAD